LKIQKERRLNKNKTKMKKKHILTTLYTYYQITTQSKKVDSKKRVFTHSKENFVFLRKSKFKDDNACKLSFFLKKKKSLF
jgi:hypothetical protein